jgi:hypothetical protein
MADRTLRGRLKRLFSTNVIVRHAGGKTLKVADTNRVQATTDLADRYTKLYSNLNPYGSLRTKANTDRGLRAGLFTDYESMDDDSILSSALDIYADESSMRSEYGDILKIRSEDDNIHDILYNLFYDIINIEFNLWPWIRNMCKYGDFFLKLEIAEKYGITNVTPLSPYIVSRIEGEDPTNPHYVKFLVEDPESKYTVGPNRQMEEELENYEVGHFRLLSDSNMLPYGKSMVEGARKTWKQLTLMEDAMLIHRIMRAPEKRIFKIDIGNIPPNEVDNYMQRIISKMKKAPVIDKDTGDYNLKYNIQNITEDFFLPVRGGDSGTEIDTAAGLTFEAVEDIDYLRNKMLAALKIPKAFLGYEDEVNAKATLAAEDVRFARTIERIQRIVVSELTKIGIVHLYSQGFCDADLVNFELNLTNPSMIYEQEKLELWSTKIDLAGSMKDNKLLSTEYMYDKIFGFTAQEKNDVRKQIIDDQKREFRYVSIADEGADPASPGGSGEDEYGEDDMYSPQKTDYYADRDRKKKKKKAMARTGDELGPEGGSPEGGHEGAGRPKRPPKFGKDGSARGRDPVGSHDMKKGGSSLALAHLDRLVKSMGKKDIKLINETNTVEEEYKREVNDTLNNDK